MSLDPATLNAALQVYLETFFPLKPRLDAFLASLPDAAAREDLREEVVSVVSDAEAYLQGQWFERGGFDWLGAFEVEYRDALVSRHSWLSLDSWSALRKFGQWLSRDGF